MRKTVFTILLLAICLTATAQESHYHKSMRQQDSLASAGLPGLGGSNTSGITSGIYWSRVRNADDVATPRLTPAEQQARHQRFDRYYAQAFDAYMGGSPQATLCYGDSALQQGLQAADLLFYMAVAHEKLGHYREARRHYRRAIAAGFPPAKNAYREFKARQKQRKKSADGK